MTTKKGWADRRVLMVGILFVVTITLGGLFALEFTTDGQAIFNDTVIGILIGATISTPLSSYVTYYTANEKEEEKEGSELKT